MSFHRRGRKRYSGGRKSGRSKRVHSYHTSRGGIRL